MKPDEAHDFSSDARGSAAGRRFLSRRIVWHTLGVVVALAVAWMIFRAYRQPDFMLDLMNMSWCALGALPIGPTG